MRRLPKKEFYSTDPLALQVWEDVVYSMDQYTNDSAVSKFFLPEEITLHCKETAAIFAQLHFSPIPTSKEVLKTRLFGLFYLSTTCGVQIYLKERAIFTNYSPYAMQTDPRETREARRKTLKQLAEGVEIFQPITDVLDLFMQQLLPTKEKMKRHNKNRDFNEELFDKLLPITLIWGYLFAKEMILDTR
ncbi:hypothetical protein BH11PAT1_BH11PAT1_7800 [soil metagenome]